MGLEYYWFPSIHCLHFLFLDCQFCGCLKLLWILTISQVYYGIFSFDKDSFLCQNFWRVWFPSSNGYFYICWFNTFLCILCSLCFIFQHTKLYLGIRCKWGLKGCIRTYFQQICAKCSQCVQNIFGRDQCAFLQ